MQQSPTQLVRLSLTALRPTSLTSIRMPKPCQKSCQHPIQNPCAQVSTANLERVRKVKTRHQRLMARVTTVREELERFLEDDDDMMKMCLTRRREVQFQDRMGTARIDSSNHTMRKLLSLLGMTTT